MLKRKKTSRILLFSWVSVYPKISNHFLAYIYGQLEVIPYVMVKVHAQMRFEKVPGQTIDLRDDSVYSLFVKDDSPKAVFYLNYFAQELS
jgi:hypothetical protein